MADLSAFASASFDPVQWIDALVKEKPEDEQLDTYITTLQMKLHVLAQDYSDQLENGMTEAMSTMPRMVQSISRMQDTIASIEAEMANLASQLQDFDQRNVVGVEDLSRLDTLKTNMETCKATLEEHARWNQLVREARTIMESGGRLSESADRLAVLSKSLDILSDVPGHDDRALTVAELSDWLLTALKPKVEAELQGKDVAALKESLHVYRKLNRESTFIDMYISLRTTKLKSAYAEVFSTSPKLFHQKLTDVYSKVHSFLLSEAAMQPLFAPSQWPSLYCDMLLRIFEPMISVAVNQISLDEYDVTEEFARRIYQFIQDAPRDKLFFTLRCIYTAFINNEDLVVSAEGRLLQSRLYDIITSINFEAVQNTDGMDDLDSLKMHDVQSVFEAFADRFFDNIDATWDALDESIQKCSQHMGGFRIKVLMKHILPMMQQHLKSYNLKVEEIRYAINLPGKGEESPIVSGAELVGSGGVAEDGFAAAAAVKRKFNISDRNMEKCKLFLTSVMQLLQAMGRMNKRFSESELSAVACYERIYNTLFLSSSDNAPSSVGAAVVCHILQRSDNDNGLKVYLQSASRQNVSAISQHVFAPLLVPMSKLKYNAECLFFDLTTLICELSLRDIETEDVWISKDAIDYDALLPQHSFTQIGEHLLHLLQAVESFAGSGVLEDLKYIFGDTIDLIPLSWLPLRISLHYKDDENCLALCRRSSCSAAIATMEGYLCDNSSSRNHEKHDHDDDPSSIFVNEWLGAVADFMVGQLLVRLVRIEKLSAFGRAQLKIDLEYLSNVIHAMGLKCHPIIFHILCLLDLEPERLHGVLNEISAQSSVPFVSLKVFDMQLADAIKRGVFP